MGAARISSAVRVAPTKVSQTGKATIATPASSTRWQATRNPRRFSTMARPSVPDPAFDETELQDGERDDDRHQHHRLRRRAAEVESLEPVRVHLVDEDRCGLSGPALGG